MRIENVTALRMKLGSPKDVYQQKKHLNVGHVAFRNHFRNVYSVVPNSVISDMHFGIHKITVNNYVNEISLFSFSQFLSYFV